MVQVSRVLNNGIDRLMRMFRVEDNRFLFWSVYYPFNFGDWIGPFLYKEISGKEPWFGVPSNYSRSTVIMSAGSILPLCKRNSIVWGSGIMNRNANFPRPAEILSVRGPFTRDRCLALGYSCPEIYGDPAILLPFFYQPESQEKKFKLGIIPHFRDYFDIKKIFADREDVLVIDVRYPIEEIVDAIVSCKNVVSSSLHGIIVCHSYDVPVGWVSFGDKMGGDGVKFHDHYASLGYFEPKCFSEAAQAPVDELISFSDSLPMLDTTEVAKKLLATCPFPKKTLDV